MTPTISPSTLSVTVTVHQHLEALFSADREARRAESWLLGAPPEQVLETLAKESDQAFAMADTEESEARLQRIADLSAQLGGAAAVALLIRILDHDEPAIRGSAGEALLELGYLRYAELATAVEKRLDDGKDGPALAELPGILGEIAEPSAVSLVRRFLNCSDPDAIAAAIEVLAELGDPSIKEDLERFVGDPRKVVLDDALLETETTLGELAEEALREL